MSSGLLVLGHSQELTGELVGSSIEDEHGELLRLRAGARSMLRTHTSAGLGSIDVTHHGKAVARLVPLNQPRALDRLVAEGLVTPAPAAKRSRTPFRITARGTVSDLVAEQRQ
ncbi:MAG: hypothetical protein ACKV2O_21285 [Acidimicrobiales bacterium]